MLSRFKRSRRPEDEMITKAIKRAQREEREREERKREERKREAMENNPETDSCDSDSGSQEAFEANQVAFQKQLAQQARVK